MPEWSNGVVSKTIDEAIRPRVRIPVSPPVFIKSGKISGEIPACPELLDEAKKGLSAIIYLRVCYARHCS